MVRLNPSRPQVSRPGPPQRRGFDSSLVFVRDQNRDSRSQEEEGRKIFYFRGVGQEDEFHIQ